VIHALVRFLFRLLGHQVKAIHDGEARFPESRMNRISGGFAEMNSKVLEVGGGGMFGKAEHGRLLKLSLQPNVQYTPVRVLKQGANQKDVSPFQSRSARSKVYFDRADLRRQMATDQMRIRLHIYVLAAEGAAVPAVSQRRVFRLFQKTGIPTAGLASGLSLRFWLRFRLGNGNVFGLDSHPF
jgi:hypothetical protein